MDIINKPLGWILKVCSQLFGNNYILAILLFALVLEILMLPFGIKQQKNSIKQAKLRPKEMAIRKRYAGRDDKPTQQKMTQEIQELYQKEGYNPMGGCLPLIIQMVILFSLYAVIIDPLKYICGLSTDAISQITSIVGETSTRSGTMGLLGAIRNMGPEAFANVENFDFNELPRLDLFGLDLSVAPSSCMNLEAIKTLGGWLILSVPVLTFASYFFSMKMSRKLTYQATTDAQMGCSNKMMDIMMPLFSVFISFGVPAALGLYWIAKSLLGVVKQVALYYAMPLPKFTDEDFKAAEKELNASKPEKAPKVAKSGKVVRSLHHIDDEDFEDTAEAAKRHKEALEAQEVAEKAEKAPVKKSGVISGAQLKDDTDKKAKKSKRSEEKAEAEANEAEQAPEEKSEADDYREKIKNQMDKNSNTENEK